MPAIVVLYKLANSLEVPCSDLFSCDDKKIIIGRSDMSNIKDFSSVDAHKSSDVFNEELSYITELYFEKLEYSIADLNLRELDSVLFFIISLLNPDNR